MKIKKTYQEPKSEVIKINGNALMEVWSIPIDNDPDHGIGAGDEDDIGAKEGFFEEDDDLLEYKSPKLWND
ncbi:hypothetical protein [Prevotella sp. OH937_COT-195]|uniref:hypothetical protein n=1 Tax=Prevotella sp. OH937_COT-195 TaxID=2491051 RepID=UPI000F650967|nr:hypothetical protein [Prevotella sp. OH937_COT-195]RRD02014.1 hypothetical protein EII32_04815 [Prevotella sp. OH937_COT-195]